MHLLFHRHYAAGLQFAISCIMGFSSELGCREIAAKGDARGQILLAFIEPLQVTAFIRAKLLHVFFPSCLGLLKQQKCIPLPHGLCSRAHGMLELLMGTGGQLGPF